MSGLTFLVVSLVLRRMYDRFYGQLGLTPEEVGLDSAEILTQTWPDVLVFVLGGGLVLSLVFAPLIAAGISIVARVSSGQSENGHDTGPVRVRAPAASEIGVFALLFAIGAAMGWWLTGPLVLPALGLSLILILQPQSGSGARRMVLTVVGLVLFEAGIVLPLVMNLPRWIVIGGLSLFVVFLISWCVFLRNPREGPFVRRQLLSMNPAHYGVIILVGIYFQVLALVISLPDDAADRANSLRAQRPVSFHSTLSWAFGENLIEKMRAEPVKVIWKGNKPPDLDTKGCLFYLGEAGGTAFVYQAETENGRDKQHLLRIPRSDVSLEATDPPLCPGVGPRTDRDGSPEGAG